VSKRILVADDHGSTRRALRTLILQRQDWQLCAEAADGLDAVEKAKSMSPDVAVLDLAMGGLNGVEAAAAIRETCPTTIILTISLYDAQPLFGKLQTLGVRAFVPKNHLSTELLPAIDAVLTGRSWFPTNAAQMTEDMFENARDVFFRPAITLPKPVRLSDGRHEPRNESLLDRIAEGSGSEQEATKPPIFLPARAGLSSATRPGCLEKKSAGRTSIKSRLKTHLLRLSYWLAYYLAAPAVYSRQPFVKYPYMNRPSEIMEIAKQLLSVDVPGAAVEVGCHQGWTTCFLIEALAEQGVHRDYVCIDTFTGFTPEDAAVEYESRGKAVGLYDDDFVVNDPQWLKASLKRSGYSHVSVHRADATAFDYQTLGKIAFALVDVDLYRPVKESLKRIIPQMARGGVVVVDDCNPNDPLWDGAYQAFMEFCKERNIVPEIACRKLGIIRT
jgi:O-methyltransferase